MEQIFKGIKLAALFITCSVYSQAQNFTGFVVTTSDSLYRGYTRILLNEGIRNVLFTTDIKKKPKSYRLEDLKYFAYKKDTFAVLKSFYPFEDEMFSVDIMEAEVLIGKGRLKLYYGIIPHYVDPLVDVVVNRPIVDTRYHYKTYFVRGKDKPLRAIRKENKKFISSIIPLISDRPDLIEMIETKKLKFDDMKEIIKLYNK